MLEIAQDPSENVRVAVRLALHCLGDKRLSHELEKMAVDPSALVRGNTAMVLGLMGEPSALKILHVLRVDSQSPAVRQNASEAMWRLGDEEGMQDLIGMTVSRYADDQRLGKHGIGSGTRDTRIRQHIRAGLAGEVGLDGEDRWLEVEISIAALQAYGDVGVG